MENNGVNNNGTLRSGTAGSVQQSGKEYGFEDTTFYDWMWPAAKEERQMREQLAMDKLSPLAKMEGLKAAGINPLTAAGAVAGSNSTLPQPSASTNPIGDIASAVGSLAGGFNAFAGGKVSLDMLPENIKNLQTDTEKKLAEIGLDNATTQSVLTDNTYKDEDWRTRLNVQRQRFTNMQEEYKNLQAVHDQILEDINYKIQQTSLAGSQEEYYDALRLQVDENVRWQKEKNNFCIDNKLFITDSGIDGFIFSMVQSGADLTKLDDFIEIYSKYRGGVAGAEARSQYSAEAEYAESISRARRNGENASDEFYGRFGGVADLAGKVASLGTRLTSSFFAAGGDLVQMGINGVSDLFKSGKAKDIRKELTMIVNNAYEQMEIYPDEKKRLQPIIDECNAALQLTNTELVSWYKKSNE